MSCKIDTTFAKVEQIGQTLLTSEIEANLKGFLDWAFLGVGAWFDVNIPTAGAWGGDFSTLRPVEDFSYTWDKCGKLHARTGCGKQAHLMRDTIP